MRIRITRIMVAGLLGLFLAIPLPALAAGTITEFTDDFGDNPGALRMFVYVPGTLRPSPALVVALHGCAQNAQVYGEETGWTMLAERWGFILLLPQQQAINHFAHCFNWFNGTDISTFGVDQERGQGEPASIKQMIDRVTADRGVDPHRIYVTGLSAGGAMTAVMLATYPEVFVGGALVAGVPYKCTTNLDGVDRCGVDAFGLGSASMKNRTPSAWGNLVRAAAPPPPAWPTVSIWQGTADKTVNPKDARELVDQWTNVHGTSRTPVKDRVRGFVHEMYKGPDGKVLVELYIIPGMGHGTPVDPGTAENQCGSVGRYSLAVDICASYYIAKFWRLDE